MIFNMPKIFLILISTLALLLPWHGAITVFLSDWGRFWKEGVIFALLILACGEGMKSIKNEKLKIKNWSVACFKHPACWAILFLLWLGILVLIEQNYYSILSARYLGMGFLMFILVSISVQNLGKKLTPIFKQFSNIFITSTAFSVLFGIWGKFGGGFEVLQNFYATTISSWVPGQVIPLYHETSEGFIRMQGGASGPVEFGHLVFVAIFLSMLHFRQRTMVNYFIFSMLLFGLYQSGSRAAIGGVVLLFIFRKIYDWTCKRKSKKSSTIDRVLKYSKILLITICGVVILKIALLGILPKATNEPTVDNPIFITSLFRLSDSAHFTRPIQAIEDGLSAPIFGNISSSGPAARARNMNENNDDSAPIAENIFADYFSQMGVVGLALALGFWVSLFLSVRGRSRIFVGVSFLLVNMATLFDMTPLSLMFFTVFAFLVTKYSK